ncbi:M23 family metallopeptidase [Rubrivirga sp. IMCC45206]|uniref:M23 family metallopeptidase n=1 Tax=Rubrivirga sp. IMCC45206 TaxID=3391614 RepID=UPI00398FB515
MRLAVLLLVLLGGCRLDRAAPNPAPADTLAAGPACDCADGRDVADAPPVAAGDTVRVTPRTAATPDPEDIGGPVALSPAGLAVPVAGIDPADLVDTFTAARSEGRTHHAIDILAPRGTPVVAARAGTIARLFESEKGGLTVYVVVREGPPATVHYYAHLDAYAPGLADGDRVARGQRIGTVGDSGNAAPGNTHLHFAIWRAPSAEAFWDGEPINPYSRLAAGKE